MCLFSLILKNLRAFDIPQVDVVHTSMAKEVALEGYKAMLRACVTHIYSGVADDLISTHTTLKRLTH